MGEGGGTFCEFIRCGAGTFSRSFKHLDRHTEKNPVKIPVMAFAGIFAGFFTMVNARFYQVSFETYINTCILSMMFWFQANMFKDFTM
jgi:hypothetical protein